MSERVKPETAPESYTGLMRLWEFRNESLWVIATTADEAKIFARSEGYDAEDEPRMLEPGEKLTMFYDLSGSFKGEP